MTTNSSCRHRPWVSLGTEIIRWMKCLSRVSFPQDVQHQKYQGVVWDIAIYWVVPLRSNTGKWRFGLEFPNLNMWCHASILPGGGDNRQPSVKMQLTFAKSHSGFFRYLCSLRRDIHRGGVRRFQGPVSRLPHLPPRQPSILIDQKRVLSINFGLESFFLFKSPTSLMLLVPGLDGGPCFWLVADWTYSSTSGMIAGRLGGVLPCERSENIEGVWGSGDGTNNKNAAYCGK